MTRSTLAATPEACTEQLLYETGQVRITRRRPGGGEPVVVKQALGAQAVRRLQHEAAVLKRLAHIDGVVRIAADAPEPHTLLLRDEGAVPLADYLRTQALGLPQTLAYARALAAILAQVHQAGVVHKDIGPTNLLIHPETLAPTLIDFNIASGLDAAQAGADAPGGLAGTLAYLSPEQTGRTGRTPDQRSDLYSLGITLYELLTGRKPFDSTDLLEMVHAHLVQVPEPPKALQPALPQIVSDLVMRLLEKEPDRRYQSAEGLAHDLAQVHALLVDGRDADFALGQFDFGARLAPPAHLIGCEAAIEALRAAAARAADGQNPCLLVTGPAGVGKSALLAQLRGITAALKEPPGRPEAAGPARAAQPGPGGAPQAWFVAAKFDPYKQDSPSAALDAFQSLGRQLLAEPEARLAAHRERIRQALGANLGLGPSLLPEFQLLLGPHEAVPLHDAREAATRTTQALLTLLRCVADPQRPLVLVFDDLQWAPPVSRLLLDEIVSSAEPIPGLLVVCSLRDGELGEGHALQAMFERWQGMGIAPATLAVGHLAPAAASAFIGAMLRLPEAEATRLADTLHERTQSNPYNTIELLNALRQDGLLRPEAGRWHWDAAAIHRHVGNASLADLLGRRIGKLPAEAAELLQTIACLGGELALDVLGAATGREAAALQQQLAPAVDDGLLAPTAGEPAGLRFTNSRVQQAVIESLDAAQRAARHLGLARRLAGQVAERPELDALTAEQYLPAAAALAEADECRRVIGFFERAAQRLRLLNIGVAERFLAAALALLQAHGTPADDAQRFKLMAEHQRALFSLGRLDEADALYAALVASAQDPLHLAEPTQIQMFSLSNRERYRDSLDLGLDLLRQLGLPKPDDVRPALGAGFQRLIQWTHGTERLADFERPEATDPRLLAWASILPECTRPAYFCDLPAFAWLVLEAHRLWVEHGPNSSFLRGACAVPSLMVGLPQDYRGAHIAGQHLCAVGDARGYQPATSFARCMWGISGGHWGVSLETVAASYQRARADMLAGVGDEQFIGYSYVAVDLLFDSQPTLDTVEADVDAGLLFAARTNNQDFLQRFRPRKQLIQALRGNTRAPCSFGNDGFDEDAYVQAIDPVSTTGVTFHMLKAVAAAIHGDLGAVASHTSLAVPNLARTPGYYLSALTRVLRAVALADQAGELPADARAPLIEELDGLLGWLSARAADAPMNYLHLQRWVEAERAWALGSVWQAGTAFDTAVQVAAGQSRPWHLALICERAAAFRMGLGMEDSARPLLARACDTYEAWGAAGKVRELRRQHAFLRLAGGRGGSDATARSTIVDTEMVDMMAVLRASQALSSETSLLRLTAQVGKVLSTITGATAVRLAVRTEDGSAWVMADSLSGATPPVTVEQAGAAGTLPFSAFRYAERTAQVLVIEDIVRDERFSADPHAQRYAQCSVMLVPILKQGALKAMLVLENEQRRNAFSGDRLESVAMIAGQLSVSLDNALLYASLEQRVAERTAQLRQKTHDINAMLQNMPQGVLTVVPGGAIHPEYSAYLATLFETPEIAGRPVMSLLFEGASLGADALSQVDAAIASVIGEDVMNFEFNAHLLVTEFHKAWPDGRVKTLALSWSPICDDAGTVDKLMVCVRDVTELKRLEAEAGARKRELQMIGEILAISQEKFAEFIDSARAFLAENRQLIEKTADKRLDTIDLLFRNMHTIKGNARTHGLQGMTHQVHLSEQRYDDLRKQDTLAWDAPLLLAELAQVSALVEQYAHLNDSVLGRKGPGRRASVDKFLMVERDTVAELLHLLAGVDHGSSAALQLALQHVGSTLHLLGTQPLRELLCDTIESLPSLAAELGKAVPEAQIEDHGIVLRTQAGGLLKNVFTHLLRNAVDHGIEPAPERLAAGKPAAGRITLRLHVDDGKLWLHLQDDGRGLAIGKIRQRALAQRLLTRGARGTDDEVAQLIFRSGFSTADTVTEVSGRGVGMDAVRGFLDKEGGAIAIRFLDDDDGAEHRRFETVITLPDRFAASPHAAMSFEALRQRLQAANA
ncbi:MAG: AAA family ATPase [Burkholderiales bacterium]|nr:AAA family ATPase [Burkholderiales bacterium]